MLTLALLVVFSAEPQPAHAPKKVEVIRGKKSAQKPEVVPVERAKPEVKVEAQKVESAPSTEATEREAKDKKDADAEARRKKIEALGRQTQGEFGHAAEALNGD